VATSPDSRKIRLILDLRRGGITDRRVLSAMERIPREAFVPEALRHQAYENVALPIGHQQTISQPLVVGRMTQALDVGDRHRVLEVGTGSGYQAAVLSYLCRRLYTVERHQPLMQEAEARLHDLRISNVTTKLGDGSLGWREQSPFDRIMVTAAADTMPEALVDQLADGGIMILPLKEGRDIQRLLRLTRIGDDIQTIQLDQVRFVPLISDNGAA
jgi:protein-L-isoaspartate(D-aspartate) O-methyltransferase